MIKFGRIITTMADGSKVHEVYIRQDGQGGGYMMTFTCMDEAHREALCVQLAACKNAEDTGAIERNHTDHNE